MKFSEHLWNEFIYSGHWLSIGASAIALTTMFLLKLPIKIEFLLIAYLGTQCIYIYNFYKEIDYDEENNSYRTNHLKIYDNHLTIITLLYAIIYITLLLIYGNTESIIFGITLLSIGLLFTVMGKNISKKIPGFKTIYTATSWALLVIFTSIYCSKTFYTPALILFTFFVFIRWIINTSFFDIKDIESDKKRNLKTLPNILGKNKFLDYLQILNLISITPIILGIYLEILPKYSIFITITFFYTLYYIYKARNNNIEITNLSYVIVDGEYIFWPILLILGSILI